MQRVFLAQRDGIVNMVNRRHIHLHAVCTVAVVYCMVSRPQQPCRIPFIQRDGVLRNTVFVPNPFAPFLLADGIFAGVVIDGIYIEAECDDGVTTEDCLDRIHASETVAQVTCPECASCAVIEVLIVIAVRILAYPDMERVPVDGIDREVQDDRRVAQARTMEDIRIIACFGQSLPYRHGVVLFVGVRNPVIADRFGHMNLDLVKHGDVVRRDTVAAVLNTCSSIIIHP